MCSIRDRAVKKMLDQTAVFKNATAVGDGFLSSGSSSADSAPVACRLVPAASRPRDFVQADQSVTRSEWQILLPLGTPAKTGGIVAVGALSFEILDTDAGAAGKTLLTAWCRKTS